MLALTDEGLARLAIAATAVPADKRDAWLQDLARTLDPPPPNRWARRRARLKQNPYAAVLKIEVDLLGLSQTLLQAGWLAPRPDGGEHDVDEIQSALTLAIDEWCRYE
jgi:hypothetical protein